MSFRSTKTAVMAAALLTSQAFPQSVMAQQLDTNCEGAFSACTNRNMNVVEEVVNAHDDRITETESVNTAQQETLDTQTTAISGLGSDLVATNEYVVLNRQAIAANGDDISANADAISALNGAMTIGNDDIAKGLAMANAMETFAPDPGSNFRMTVGTGYYDSQSAIGMTGIGRVDGDGTLVYLGVSRSAGIASGKAGMSFQW